MFASLRRISHALSALVALALASPLGASAAAATAPLQPGSNAGVSDSFVGRQSWTFVAKPGSFQLDVRLGSVPPNSLPGAPFTTVLHVVPFSNAKLHFTKTPGGYVYTGTILHGVNMRLEVIPPNSMLVRESLAYTVEATGSIVYAKATEPIVGTYTGPNGYGAMKFLANGTIQASNGETGTWTLFDAETKVYTVVMGQFRYSVKYVSGQGLVDAGNGNLTFQAVH